MLTSLYSGLTGLNANAFALSLIGNNLANVNTPGFKSSMPAFHDLLSQILTGGSSQGTVNFLQIGLGTGVSSTNQNFAQGSLQTTGINTNVAIQGAGFFALDGPSGVGYTRAGDFHIDANGDLVTADGDFVQGYSGIDPVTGQVITSGALGNIHVPPGTIFPPVATSLGTMVTNLDANAPAGDIVSSSLRVFDSLGAAHQVDFTFTKTAGSAYDYDITIDGGSVTGGTSGTPFSLGSGTLGFDGGGQLIDVDGAAAANLNITTPTFTNGGNALAFTWQLLDPNGGTNVTNYAASSGTSSSTQNGFPAGSISAIVVGADGTIQGAFNNGQVAPLARLALVTFNNPTGLLKLGDNRFASTLPSGLPSIGVPGSGGRGGVSGGTLELSNVDMATEFVNMIVAQRGYQANSRIITTTDEILQESINLKR